MPSEFETRFNRILELPAEELRRFAIEAGFPADLFTNVVTFEVMGACVDVVPRGTTEFDNELLAAADFPRAA